MKKDKTKSRLEKIDRSVFLLQNGTIPERESSSRDLLEIFHPLVISAAQRIANRFPHNLQEIIPVVQNKLIVIIIEFRTPRKDTRGNGRPKGGWAPNINVYLRQNLYYFSMLEIRKDISGSKNSNQGSTVVIQDICDYETQGTVEYDYDVASEMLDMIESEYGAKIRDVVMFKYLFGFKYAEISWITDMSNIQIRNSLSRVKNKFQSAKL